MFSESPAVSLEDIKQFRQLDGKCPGHPEYRHTTGVEATTGPLGQGCATSVGMAIAERWLVTHSRSGQNSRCSTTMFMQCAAMAKMMEGVTSEAASLAGHLMLGNLTEWPAGRRLDTCGVTIFGVSGAFPVELSKLFYVFKAYGRAFENIVVLVDPSTRARCSIA